LGSSPIGGGRTPVLNKALCIEIKTAGPCGAPPYSWLESSCLFNGDLESPGEI
jgi:hypothetical protein